MKQHSNDELRITATLRKWRKDAGMNQKDLSEKLGVSVQAISRLELNPLNAKLSTLIKYASACDKILWKILI